MPQITRRLTRAVAATALLVGSTLLGACTTNAATGRTQLSLLSRTDEISLGQEAAPELIIAYGGEVPSAELQAYVTNIGMKLAAQTEGDNPSLPWSFIFLNSDVINAFALPGGQVFITRGLVERMDNEAQLAGVLGHEIGHVTARHANNRIVRQTGLSIAVALGTAVINPESEEMQMLVNGLVTGAGVYALTFDRGQESESDRLGMRYMSKAGYDPTGQLQVMHILKDASSGASQPEWLSTHPLPQTRIEDIEGLLRDEFAGAVSNPANGLYRERFQSSMLSKLNALPAPQPMSLKDAETIQRWLAEHTDCECHEHGSVSAH
ncbi:MAG: M48 family metalloprotease [Phycisphaerales bacterium JB050]